MNYAGTPLISRPTVATGRSLFFFAVGIVLSAKLEIDLSNLAFLGLSFSAEALAVGASWVLAILWVSHLVHWIGDLVSLGKWNSSMIEKLGDTNYSGGNRMKGRLEYVLDKVHEAFDGSSDYRNETLQHVVDELSEMKNSLWWHEKLAIFYVVGWYMVVPTGLSVWAYCLMRAS